MHQNLAEVYRSKVTCLQEAITSSPDNAGVLERPRDLVDRVDIGQVRIAISRRSF